MTNVSSCDQISACPPVRMYNVLLFVILLFHGTVFAPYALAQHKKIAIFGSSVAKGSGDTTGTGGYAGLLKTMLEQNPILYVILFITGHTSNYNAISGSVSY